MRLSQVAAVLTGLALLSQVAYPLVDGDPRAASNPTLAVVTAASVLLFGSATVVHVAATAGPRAAALVAGIAGGTGLAAEAVGVATGFPFGTYSYTGSLGPQLLGVPVLVPMAWVMMAYPCLLAGRTVTTRRWTAVAASAWLLAAWDLFLDPQMVHAGQWRWTYPNPGLPGIPDVPLTNFLGWLLVATVIQAALHVAVPWRRDTGSLAAPAVLLGWTWLGSTLANLAFFGRPAVAAYGFVAMGVVAAPALSRWVRA